MSKVKLEFIDGDKRMYSDVSEFITDYDLHMFIIEIGKTKIYLPTSSIKVLQIEY